MNLPEEFLSRMKENLKGEYEDFLNSYQRAPYKGLRVNTAKISVEQFKKITPFELQPVSWNDTGFYITEEKPGRHIYHQAGLYYCQEPSAMCSAPLLEVQDGERVLDLCSAPGGKGTQLAQQCPNGIVVLNEINYSRAKILSQNVERMGLKAIVTSASPQQLAKNFEGYFDKILVDAPCSGEGMFLKEEYAIPEWSLENVKMCAQRQQEILLCAHKMLRGGGRIVYSTCTFAPEEDELQIENFCHEHSEYQCSYAHKILPHKEQGEGHYVAVLNKMGDFDGDVDCMQCSKDQKAVAPYLLFEKEVMQKHLKNFYLVGNQLYSIPDQCPKMNVQVLRCGIHLGELIKGRFEPSHALAMYLNKDECASIELSEQQANLYLRGQTFEYETKLKGWCIALYHGYSLGWCKVVQGVVKNHYPKGLRLL